MLKADAGVFAMHDPSRNSLFVKHARYDSDANYPLGANLACYIGPDNFMVELETMGPFVTLKRGDTLRHIEPWLLRPAGRQAPCARQLRALFRS